MGFTPLAGIMMGTRSGDVDPSLIPFVMKKEGLTIDEIIDKLNKKSGLLGMSEESSDMRDIIEAKGEGNKRAEVAFNKFVRRVVDYISQYYTLLEGVNAIVFTAGIGENSNPVREAVCKKLKCLGVELDEEANQNKEKFMKISTDNSKIDVFVVDTDEEIMIAKDTYDLIK